MVFQGKPGFRMTCHWECVLCSALNTAFTFFPIFRLHSVSPCIISFFFSMLASQLLQNSIYYARKLQDQYKAKFLPHTLFWQDSEKALSRRIVRKEYRWCATTCGSPILNWCFTDALKLSCFDTSTCSVCFLSNLALSRHAKRYILESNRYLVCKINPILPKTE